MALLTQISWLKPELALGQQKIAEFILQNAQSLMQITSQGLAEQVGVSQSAVVKFSQKLGFSGFPALKLAIIQELNQAANETVNPESVLHNRIESGDSLLVIAQKLAYEKNHSIAETTRRLDFDRLQRVVEHLDRAGRIQIVGIGGAGLVAKDLSFKLQKIGLITLVESDHHVQIVAAQTLSEGDVQIVISFSGNRKDMLIAAKVARQRGATVVAICGNRKSRLCKLADYMLESLAEEDTWRSSAISSRTAQNTVTDLLFMALMQRREATARRFVEGAREMIDSLDE